MNAAIGVPVTTAVTWNVAPGAMGYRITIIRSNLTGDRVVDNFDVSDATTYQPPVLEPNTRYFLVVIPYNNNGEAQDCLFSRFTTSEDSTALNAIEIPKFFTPNNDGFNDFWSVRYIQGSPITGIFIFNRYGQLLKQIDENQAWDGTFNGSPLIADTYWYKITTQDGNALKGFFALKR